MNQPIRFALATGALLTAAGALAQSTTPEPQGGAWDSPLAESLAASYLELLKEPPRAPIARLVMDTETGAIRRKLETGFERQADGTLLTIQLIPGQVKIFTRSLTVRGLPEIRGRTEIDTSITSAPVLIGKGVYSPGWKLGSATSAVNAIGQQLTGDLAAMANPSPDSAMSFGVKADVFIAQTGMFGKVNFTNAKRDISYACKTGKVSPASALLPKLKGDYLPVQCDVIANGKSSVKKYVYLVDSQQYVMISSIDAAVANFNQSASFVDVEYAAGSQ